MLEFVPMAIQLIELVRRFNTGEIQLPLMQRDYVWKSAKVVKLLDSIYKKWPIGCFYVWHTAHERQTKGRVGHASGTLRPLDNFYGYLLDGQQRLTSLSLAIEGPDQQNLATRAFFDVENERFFLGEMTKTVQRRIEANDPTLVPLSSLISSVESSEDRLHERLELLVDQLLERRRHRTRFRETTSADYRRRLLRVANMLNVDALCEEFRNEYEKNAIELFARLNKGGTSLSTGDVEAARLSQEGTSHIVGPMREFVQEPELRRLGLNFVFAVRALVTIYRGSASFVSLPQDWASDAKEIEKAWRQTERGLRVACDLVREEFGWTNRRWLPSINALIPIAYLMKDSPGKPTRQEREHIRRFLLLTGFRSLFRGSVETTINSYVNAVRNTSALGKNRAASLTKKIPQNRLYKIRPEDIKGASGMYSPVMQVYLAYLVNNEARSWPSNRLISEIASHDVTGDMLAVHHIFPKKFMNQFDVPAEKLNTAANYAILAQADNAELSDRDPAHAHRQLSPTLREVAAEQLFFRVADEKLNHLAYEEFVDFRARAMAERLNEFLDLGMR